MTSIPCLITSKKFFKLSETCNTISVNVFGTSRRKGRIVPRPEQD